MKKLIAILTIAIVLVGAVFADDPLAANDAAQIHVNATITTKKPVYSLTATGWAEAASGAGANASIGASDTMVHGSVSAESIRIGDDVLSEHDVTVNFTIKQTVLSRVKGTYTLTVSADPLVITAITKQDGTTSTVAADLDAEHNRFAVSAAPTISKGASGTEPANTEMVNTTAGVLAITYNGKKVAADTTIGTFAYTWTHDDACAPGTYEANVTLTITSIN